MIQRILLQFQKKKWKFILLGLIFALGIFLRTYHFGDWLLFEIDQSYDTRIVSEAIDNGISNLPLLGPTAGGGRALRLGPAFYYMEYMSALIFGNTPTGHAMLILLCSLLSLPLFFLLVRRYFSPTLSFFLFTLFSFSSYLVLYGRFSWSPNILPFLVTAFLYTLLKSVEKNTPHNDRWFLLFVAIATVASQIHFNAFFTLPTIAVLFLLYKRPHFHLRTWFLAFGIIMLIYSPMILSDISTHGENIGFFLSKVSKSGDPFKNFLRTFTVDAHYMASGTLLVNTGIDHISGGRIRGYGFQNDENLMPRIIALVFFFLSMIVLCFNILREKDVHRKDFFVLIFLGITISSAYFYSLLSSNFQIFPRFYLLVVPLFIILPGILPEKISVLRFGKILLIVLLFFMITPNVMRLYRHFYSLSHPFETTSVEREDIFPNNKRLTLAEQEMITTSIKNNTPNKTLPVYINTFHEYEPVFWYHLNKQGIVYTDTIDENNLYEQGYYFLIKYRDGGTRGIDHFTVETTQDFGVLRVYTLRPKSEYIRAMRQDTSKSKLLKQITQIQALKTWRTYLLP